MQEEIIKIEQNDCEIVAVSDKEEYAKVVADNLSGMFDAIICWN